MRLTDRYIYLRGLTSLLILTAVCPARGLGQYDHVFAVRGAEVVEQAMGPYNVNVLQGGNEFVRPLSPGTHLAEAAVPYSLSLQVKMSLDVPATTLIAGLGDPASENSRFLGLQDGHPVFRVDDTHLLMATNALSRDGWHSLAVVFDGTVATLYVDGKHSVSGVLPLGRVVPQLVIGPIDPGQMLKPTGHWGHFGGQVAAVLLQPEAVDEASMRKLALPLNLALLRFDEASPPWPVQTRGQAGYTQQQDASLMPVGRSELPLRTAAKAPQKREGPALQGDGQNRWLIRGNWRLSAARDIAADAKAISTVGLADRTWMQATVPGTVLTTMVAEGIYPDPDYGLNNMAIPESLAHQDYWYRVQFDTPKTSANQFELTLNGINYAAEVWLNGQRLGTVKGAFVRGRFDATGLLHRSGPNALAVRISPPPHPGIPNEQSIAGGPGENGGTMVTDGPTFSASEGWDWIPAIRDRNSGLWQDIVLTARGSIHVGDVQVVTRLLLPDTSSAEVEIVVPLTNSNHAATRVALHANFEGVELTKDVDLSPGATSIGLTSAEFDQLHVSHPRLWWPNGYGKPDLYHLTVTVDDAGKPSDHAETTFGIREVTYELSLFDTAGKLRRVEVSPTVARHLEQQIVNVTHAGMLRREAEFAAASLTLAGEKSPAVQALENPDRLTDLVLKVNGVRIAARGGNWGMDDSRKRVSREHLEPYFRLHRDANLNIIRNWMGQDTEETFYQLADEYGLMVWNDFWESTQDYNAEAADVPLFLANARDTVRRFRNHPSIVMWCGRNEGVPQPILNEGLIAVLHEEDGTRYYTPSSNRVNLRNSGPYHYQDPRLYFTTLDRGFSVELGISSLSTLESLQASIAPADLWPIGDAWAYHDWHWSGNGDVHPFMEAMDRQLGAGISLKDFERKAQMFNYVHHRAIFEGFNQHLWQPNSGRLLWMTQPAWPSNMWQIFSSDYDTNASYYGVKKACEPVHVQLDPSNYEVAGVNTTGVDAGTVNIRATVYSLFNAKLLSLDGKINLSANHTVQAFVLPLHSLFVGEGTVLVRLEMLSADGRTLSANTYWMAEDENEYRKLNSLLPSQISSRMETHRDGEEEVVDLFLTNTGTSPALEVKATLKDSHSDKRILPAYFSDNYVNLLPGESSHITVRYPRALGEAVLISLRGWNLAEGMTVGKSAQAGGSK